MTDKLTKDQLLELVGGEKPEDILRVVPPLGIRLKTVRFEGWTLRGEESSVPHGRNVAGMPGTYHASTLRPGDLLTWDAESCVVVYNNYRADNPPHLYQFMAVPLADLADA